MMIVPVSFGHRIPCPVVAPD